MKSKQEFTIYLLPTYNMVWYGIRQLTEVESIYIQTVPLYQCESSQNTDPITKIIEKFQYHLSILSITHNVVSGKFSFKHFSEDDISSEIKNMNKKKASTGIPIKFLKEQSDILSGKLKDILNNCLDEGIFPDYCLIYI